MGFYRWSLYANHAFQIHRDGYLNILVFGMKNVAPARRSIQRLKNLNLPYSDLAFLAVRFNFQMLFYTL